MQLTVFGDSLSDAGNVFDLSGNTFPPPPYQQRLSNGPTAVDAVLRVLDRVSRDSRGRWLFDPTHQDAQSELALAGDDGGTIVHVTIDRTFVDSAVAARSDLYHRSAGAV